MISDLQQRISAALRKGRRQVEARGTVQAENPGRALAGPWRRPYVVTESCCGVSRRWVEFPKAGGAL